MADNSTHSQIPTPDPALKRLDRLVGTWSLEGHLRGSDEMNIKGQATFRWLPGGFFLEQHVKIDFMGLDINSLEFIGYDPETMTYPGLALLFAPGPKLQSLHINYKLLQRSGPGLTAIPARKGRW
jgi:hypothetical protein